MFVGYSALYTYITPYIIKLFPEIETWMSLFLIAIGAAAFTGNQIGGQISDKFGYKKSMLIGATLQLICVFLIIVTRSWLWLNILSIILWVMFAWMTGLQLNLGIMQETSHDANFVVSLNGSSIQLSSAIGTSFAAIIITQFGLSQLVFITLFSITISLIVQIVSIRRYSLR